MKAEVHSIYGAIFTCLQILVKANNKCDGKHNNISSNTLIRIVRWKEQVWHMVWNYLENSQAMGSRSLKENFWKAF